MEIDVEKLAAAGRRFQNNLDGEDLGALRVCLLSAGALVGLSAKRSFTRRLMGTACSFLTVGLSIPLITKYVDELHAPDPLADITLLPPAEREEENK